MHDVEDEELQLALALSLQVSRICALASAAPKIWLAAAETRSAALLEL
jgi:hypothetical protein